MKQKEPILISRAEYEAAFGIKPADEVMGSTFFGPTGELEYDFVFLKPWEEAAMLERLLGEG